MENGENKEKNSFIEKLKRKYRLVVYNDQNYEPVFKLNYSKFWFLFTWITGGIVFIAIIYSLVAYTPVRELIPGYPTTSIKRNLIYNAKLVDSLEYEIKLRDQYFSNLHNIVMGNEPVTTDKRNESVNRSEDYHLMSFVNDTQTFRGNEEVEQENYYITENKKINANISSLHFFTPVKGMVTNKFNPKEGHYGIDIVSSSNEVVKAILPGTVILATWTLETGNVIQLQHDNNLVSVYKHNAERLKKVGTHVDAGEPIAIVGNSGELTTGPHLHFELWYGMIPVNPEDFINF